MSFQDKSIQCSDCGATFIFSAEEQEFFKTKGYTNDPRRCPTCRAKKSRVRLEVAVTAAVPETEAMVQPRGRCFP